MSRFYLLAAKVNRDLLEELEEGVCERRMDNEEKNSDCSEDPGREHFGVTSDENNPEERSKASKEERQGKVA